MDPEQRQQANDELRSIVEGWRADQHDAAGRVLMRLNRLRIDGGISEAQFLRIAAPLRRMLGTPSYRDEIEATDAA